jgi:hypothetical protein
LFCQTSGLADVAQGDGDAVVAGLAHDPVQGDPGGGLGGETGAQAVPGVVGGGEADRVAEQGDGVLDDQGDRLAGEAGVHVGVGGGAESAMPGDRPERGGVDRQFVGVVPAAVAIAVCHSRQARIGQVAVQVSVGCPWAMPTFLDAAAVNALLLGSRSGARRGVPLILVAVPPHVRRVLKM